MAAKLLPQIHSHNIAEQHRLVFTAGAGCRWREGENWWEKRVCFLSVIYWPWSCSKKNSCCPGRHPFTLHQSKDWGHENWSLSLGSRAIAPWNRVNPSGSSSRARIRGGNHTGLHKFIHNWKIDGKLLYRQASTPAAVRVGEQAGWWSHLP